MSLVESGTAEVGEGLRGLDLNVSSTALTYNLQCCTLTTVSAPAPLSLFPTPPDLRPGSTKHDHRLELAADGPEAFNASAPVNCIPSWSTTPPIRRRTVSNERRRRLRPRTTWHPSSGHWTWTSPALRTLRCAAFAEREGRGSKRKVTSDATIDSIHARIDRLKRRVGEIEGRRGGGAVSDATHHSQTSEETSCVTVEEAPPPQQISHSRPCPAAPAYAVPSIYYDDCHKLASD
jgi:hypothetical protein